MTPATPAPVQSSNRRRGVVIVAVLVVITVLSLAAYRFSDAMLAEAGASESVHRNVQARHFADSGIHYAMALMSRPETFGDMFGGNPWNNPQAFKGIPVPGELFKGKFSLIAPADPSDMGMGNFYYGLVDESSKINLNALMALGAELDTTGDPGKLCYTMLMAMKLPDMTDEIANSIVNWMLPADVAPRPGGATNDSYTAMTPPYRCKNGPLDSIDELLLVKGVTRDLLYGTDYNRNGSEDADEAGSTGFTRGWSAFFTVHSREQNRDATGAPYININAAATDFMTNVYRPIGEDLGYDAAKFIYLARRYTSGLTTDKADAKLSDYADPTVTATTPLPTLYSVYDLLGKNITVGSGKNKKVYANPFTDQPDLLVKLFNAVTVIDDPTPDVAKDLSTRINILTAPEEVLRAIPGMPPTAVTAIVENRPKLSQQDALPTNFQSAAWLLTVAKMDPADLRNLDNRKQSFITTRTQVYRVQSVGYFDGSKGPAIRVEAVIDANYGQPRIVAWRDLSELGKGISEMP